MLNTATYRVSAAKTVLTLSARMLLAAVFVLSARGASAQTNSTSAYSPYSMFGIGELATQGALPMRSMGGVGVAWRSPSVASLLNPAGYSATVRKSMIFNFGAEGMYVDNAQRKYDASGALTGTAHGSKTSLNFHEISLQMPLAKGLGMGLSLTPFSSVGYNISATEQNEDIWGEVGRVRYNWTGEGDITEVKLGVGYEIFKNFSLGVAGMYYWGAIDRSYTGSVANNVVGEGSYYSVIGNDNYSVSNFKFQAGAQYSPIANSKRILTLGVTYDLGGSLRPKVTKNVYVNNLAATTVVYKDDESSPIRLPEQWAAGIFYEDVRLSVGVDYVYRSWGGKNGSYAENVFGGMKVGYANTNTFKAGVQITPNRYDVRNYFNRVSYRVGVRYGDYYQTFGGVGLDEYAVTLGFGFPVQFLGSSSIDFGIEYGGRGSHKKISESVGMIRQNYIKIAIGISMFGDDYWFVRPKYD